jgi:hypothetical protein
MVLEVADSRVGVLITSHYSSVIRKVGKDGVGSGWYVGSEEQIEEGTKDTSLGDTRVDWEIWGGFGTEFDLGVSV